MAYGETASPNPTKPLATAFAIRAMQARIKAERSSVQRKVDRQKLRALLYQRFAQRLRGAGDAMWTKE